MKNHISLHNGSHDSSDIGPISICLDIHDTYIFIQSLQV